MTYKEFKQLFLDLTAMTVPHGSEYIYYNHWMKHLIDFELQQDGENFYYTVGDGSSTTLFCSHLDTADSISKEVRHGFANSIIYTESDTLLGADDKAGVVTMLYLMYNKVPGTYYFFAGEECGRIGSIKAAASHREYFSKFDRAIAFDRMGKGSIISNQFTGRCASPLFVDALIGEYKNHYMKMYDDPTGSYTDTASFMRIIPECTNISIGYHNQHTKSEFINIDYAFSIARASAQINWDDLPVDRDIAPTANSFHRNNYSGWNSRDLEKDEEFWYMQSSSDKREVGTFNSRNTEYYPPKSSSNSKEGEDKQEIVVSKNQLDSYKKSDLLTAEEILEMQNKRRMELKNKSIPEPDGLETNPPPMILER